MSNPVIQNASYRLQQLNEVPPYKADVESQHIQADGHLLDILKSVASMVDDTTAEHIEDAVEAFESLCKWYA